LVTRSARRPVDLGRTKPPIAEIVDVFETVYPSNPIRFVIEVHERLAPRSLADLQAKLERPELNYDDIRGATGRQSVLLGTRRWQDSRAA
jgi:hypothetical protein